MKRKCKSCGMLRAQKDMVLLNDKKYLCFSCWNRQNRERSSSIRT